MDCEGSNIFKIFTGNSAVLKINFVAAGTYTPLDLTDCTEIDVALPNADGSFAHLLLSDDDVVIVGEPILGKISAEITAEVSALLLPGELQNLYVTFTIAGTVKTVKMPQLSVYEND